ncbi:MAG: orotidine 5'-phosphate decarboxylase / HUMPS family protein, partial [Planctomycetota bacterium]
MGSKLQVALDFVNLKRALKVARESVEGGADILEAGTPLIKSEGLDAVRALKS